VVPLVGPVSLLLALAASGLNGQNFAFVGYLPQDGAARRSGCANWRRWRCAPGRRSVHRDAVPQRGGVAGAAAGLKPDTRVAVARADLADGALPQRERVGVEAAAVPGRNDLPAVFAIGA
jgi:16S rRNA (cytidine1402-2'-O)-methyltransferase